MTHTHKLNSEQEDIVKHVRLGKNVFVTGSAGVGKSFTVEYVCKDLDDSGKIYRLVAPTGVAAVNIGGQTIHRFLGIRPDIKTIVDYKKSCMKRTKVPWNLISTIIIDEVSMIHPKLFELFDEICKLHRRNNKPFGGLQLILLGDFFQLSPIKNKDDEAEDPDYIFETTIWENLNLEKCHLKQVMRQNDQEFINALNDLRVGLLSDKVLEMMRKCSKNRKEPGKHYVRLFPLNVQRSYANDIEMKKIQGETRMYKSVDIGDERLLKDCRAAKEITLKIGCPVMLLWNLPDQSLCNGSLGIVQSYDDIGLPIVKFNNGSIIPITQQKWSISERNKYGPKILAQRTQIPLAVAFAFTSHKVQSLTLDHLEVDCSGTFTTGQLYVSLSRAATMEGLRVKNFKPENIMTDPKVIEFYQTLEGTSENVIEPIISRSEE